MALTLRTLGRLTNRDRLRLVPVPTMNQRLTRAKARFAAQPFLRYAVGRDIPGSWTPCSRVSISSSMRATRPVPGIITSSGANCAPRLLIDLAVGGLAESRPELGPQPEALGLAALLLLRMIHAGRRARMRGRDYPAGGSGSRAVDRGQIDAGVGCWTGR